VVSRNLVSWGACSVGLGAIALLMVGERVIEAPGRIEAAMMGRPYDGLRCTYRETTGRRCVGCGATTAFLLARRGELLASAKTSMLGLSAAVGLALLAAGASVTGVSGRLRPLLVAVLGSSGLAVVGLGVQFVRWWTGSLG